MQVGDHPPQHVDLLRVLLPVEGEVGSDDREELEADGRDAAEMAGSVLAFEDRSELEHVDPGLVAGRVHLADRRREDDVDPGLARELEIPRLVARVAVQVGRLAELGGIDEEAHHDRVAVVARGAEQCEMALVERAHRRHEPDRPVPSVGQGRPDVGHRARDDHAVLPCDTASRAVRSCQGVVGVEQLGRRRRRSRPGGARRSPSRPARSGR